MEEVSEADVEAEAVVDTDKVVEVGVKQTLLQLVRVCLLLSRKMIISTVVVAHSTVVTSQSIPVAVNDGKTTDVGGETVVDGGIDELEYTRIEL